MRKRLLLLPLLAASALSACSVQDTTVSAYTSDEPLTPGGTTSSRDATCVRLADTGDMYRYCMEYGPQLALAAERD
jgi:hypothetical protein